MVDKGNLYIFIFHKFQTALLTYALFSLYISLRNVENVVPFFEKILGERRVYRNKHEECKERYHIVKGQGVKIEGD
jgi:hypothetical protein